LAKNRQTSVQDDADHGETADALRADKLLFFLRFFKTRGTAMQAISGKGLRINGRRTSKASALVRTGDVLTFARAREIVCLRIDSLPDRRGPAQVAQACYTLLDSD